MFGHGYRGGTFLSGPEWYGSFFTHPDPLAHHHGRPDSGWTHPDPRNAHAVSWPPGTFTHPDPKKRKSALSWTQPGAMPDPMVRDPVTASPWPWTGLDPAWTYDSPASLLSQALRKSRARVVKPSDPRYPLPPTGQLGPNTKQGHALWRWQPQFRIQAVVNELMGRFHVAERAVWLLEPLNKNSRTCTAHCLFDLGPLNLEEVNFDTQIDKVLRAAVEREDRLPEILTQADDTSLFFESITGISRAAAPITFELMDAAQSACITLLMGLKHQIAARRPVELSAQVQPVIPTPGHGALPSGHATISAMHAALWSGLLYGGGPSPDRSGQLDSLARRVAFNRVVAGLHFPMDSRVGYRLGHQLARALMAMADPGPNRCPAVVDMAVLNEDHGKEPAVWELPEQGQMPKAASGPAAIAAPLLQEMWSGVQQELEQLRV